MPYLIDEITRFVSNLKAEDYIALLSAVVAFIAVIVSLSSLRLAKNALNISSSRDSSREAGHQANRMREIIALSGVDALKFSQNSKITDRKVNNFEKKNLNILTELNILSSSFTRTGRLAEEKLAYSSVGYLLCSFLNQGIVAIKYIHDRDGRYGDLSLIYTLWNTREKIRKVRRMLNKFEKESIDTQKMIIRLSWELITQYLITWYEYRIKKDKKSKERQIVIKTNMQKLTEINTDFRKYIKEKRGLLKEQKANERYLEKKIEKHLLPLGVHR